MFLTAERHKSTSPTFDPYTEAGARRLLDKHRREAYEMIDYMLSDRERYGTNATTNLKGSPLQSKPYVAGALKTLGYIEEIETKSGACVVRLTLKGASV